MTKLTKQTRLFTLIGVLASVIGYGFLMYKGFNLNNEINALKSEQKSLDAEIAKKKSEVEQLNVIRREKNKQLIKLENELIEITSTSNDRTTVQEGKTLAQELGIPMRKHFEVTTAKDISLEDAQKYEKMGYEYLLDRNVTKAIDAFIESENSYNGYHQVAEIARILTKNKARLSTKDAEYWGEVYQTIITKCSWKMPEDYQIKLREQVDKTQVQTRLNKVKS